MEVFSFINECKMLVMDGVSFVLIVITAIRIVRHELRSMAGE